MARLKFRPIPQLTPEEIERFWGKVKIGTPNECWLWLATRQADNDGYGRVGITKRGETWSIRANRLAYALFNGVDPGPYLVCHKCDNPPCCNPHHFFLGNNRQNMIDCRDKGRMPMGTSHYWVMNQPQHMVGERNTKAKITDRHAKKALALYRQQRATSHVRRGCIRRAYVQFTILFGSLLSESQFSKIVYGYFWKHVQPIKKTS